MENTIEIWRWFIAGGIFLVVMTLAFFLMRKMIYAAQNAYELIEKAEDAIRAADRTPEDAQKTFDMLLVAQAKCFEKHTYAAKSKVFALWEGKFEGMFKQTPTKSGTSIEILHDEQE